MKLALKNYHSHPRIVQVSFTKSINPDYETLSLQSGFAEFSSDGLTIPLEDQAELWQCELHTGDIITVSDKGTVYKLFNSEENDATVYLTGVCNSNCVMCPTPDYERKNNRGLPDNLLMAYLNMLPECLEHITVTGGEPTMRTELFFQVMGTIAQRFSETETLLLSNGRSFASKAMVSRLMEQCPRYLTVAIPVHGHCPSLHDGITRVDGSLRQTKMGIHHLLSKGINIEIRIVVSALNYKNLSEIAQMIVDQFPNVGIVNFIGLEMLGNCAKNRSLVYIDYKESFPFIRPAVDCLVAAGIDVSLYNYPLCTVDAGYRGLCRKSITPYKVRYAQDCERCKAKSQCGGWFGSTLAIAKPRVFPFKSK